MDGAEIRGRILAPLERYDPLRKQLLRRLALVQGGGFRPAQAGGLGRLQVLANRALGNGTTGGDLLLFESEGMKPQYFFDLAHGQPLLRQSGSSTAQWKPDRRCSVQRAS
jgi:hypothetical protein